MADESQEPKCVFYECDVLEPEYPEPPIEVIEAAARQIMLDRSGSGITEARWVSSHVKNLRALRVDRVYFPEAVSLWAFYRMRKCGSIRTARAAEPIEIKERFDIRWEDDPEKCRAIHPAPQVVRELAYRVTEPAWELWKNGGSLVSYEGILFQRIPLQPQGICPPISDLTTTAKQLFTELAGYSEPHSKQLAALIMPEVQGPPVLVSAALAEHKRKWEPNCVRWTAFRLWQAKLVLLGQVGEPSKEKTPVEIDLLSILPLPAGWKWWRLDSPMPLPADESTVTNNAKPCRHSVDFHSVCWFGAEHAFSGNQAKIVRHLWEAWENGTPGVGGQTLLELADAAGNRLDLVFRGHPAWGTMIVSKRKGSYCLQENPPPKSLKANRRKKASRAAKKRT